MIFNSFPEKLLESHVKTSYLHLRVVLPTNSSGSSSMASLTFDSLDAQSGLAKAQVDSVVYRRSQSFRRLISLSTCLPFMNSGRGSLTLSNLQASNQALNLLAIHLERSGSLSSILSLKSHQSNSRTTLLVRIHNYSRTIIKIRFSTKELASFMLVSLK